jgi:hypothetical protein
MDRQTFAWATRSARPRRTTTDSALRRCYDELSVIADHVTAARGLDGSSTLAPVRRSRR